MIKCKTIAGLWFILFGALILLCCGEASAQQPSASCTITTSHNGVTEWTIHYKNLPDISGYKFLLDSSLKVRYFKKPYSAPFNVIFDAESPNKFGNNRGYYFSHSEKDPNLLKGQLLVSFSSNKIDCDLDLAYDGNYHVEDHARIQKSLPILLDEKGRGILGSIKCSIEMMTELKSSRSEDYFVAAEKSHDLHLVKQLVLNRY